MRSSCVAIWRGSGIAAAGHTGAELVDQLHHSLSGSFTHTILEWSAFCTAIFTVTLSLVHFSITKDVTTPMIDVALFCAGCMDAFHTLAADRLIHAVADNTDLIPFTWALCRMFNALIMIIGVGIIMIRGNRKATGNVRFVLLMSLAFGIAAYVTIHICATSSILPQTQFPDAIITRPYDAVPMVLFILAGLFVYPRMHRISPSLFTHGLIISMIPEVVTQAHMTFGSSQLFDNHFNIAHFLKIVAYLVPFVGLCFDYVSVYRKEVEAVDSLKATERDLRSSIEETARINEVLIHKNEELDEFTHVASHDLQEPLRKLVSFSELLRGDVGTELNEEAARDLEFIEDAATRMSDLVRDLLVLSRSGRSEAEKKPVDLDDCLDRAREALLLSIEESGAEVTSDPLGSTNGDRVMLTQLLQNLIGNALEFRAEDRKPSVHISRETRDGVEVFVVADNGIGIEHQYMDQIFTPFKRLHSRVKYGGTGIGLAICRKAVERHDGRIWVESDYGSGSRFYFTLHETTPPGTEDEAGDPAGSESAAIGREEPASREANRPGA